jgi:hypothetical protein
MGLETNSPKLKREDGKTLGRKKALLEGDIFGQQYQVKQSQDASNIYISQFIELERTFFAAQVKVKQLYTRYYPK